MKLTKIAIFLSASLLFAGCSKTDNTNNTNAKSTTSNTTNVSASPKATVEASQSPSATTSQSKKPEDAANGLLNAWKKKDRTEAAKFATEDAYTKLFTEGGGPEGMESQGCSNEKGVYNCGYTYPGGALIMIVNGSEAAGYKVHSIVFVAD
jgi:hypothetical protein